MAIKKINNIGLIQILKSFSKSYFTVADLEKILEMKRDVLYVTLNRLVKNGVLIKLKRGIYQAAFQNLEAEKIANELYYPSYLSFESILSKYGIINQIPYTLTFATNKVTKKLHLGNKEIEYRQLKSELFFGYGLVEGVYCAEPEKAVLDQLYLISKGKITDDIREWSLVGLNKNKLLQYSKKFPEIIQKNIKNLIPKLGKHVITIDRKEIL